MNVIPAVPKHLSYQLAVKAALGLIVPSGNRMSEVQFNHFAPPGLSIHAARGRVAGTGRSIAEMMDEILTAARLVADCQPDLIVFHCTETAMREGRAGEQILQDRIAEASGGIATVSTSALVLEAIRALGIKRPLILSPYASNGTQLRYLAEAGITVAHDVALGLKGRQYETVPPQRWLDLACEHDRADADGIFLACTATSQIEAIPAIEHATGKPVVNSNQAVLWGSLKRLRDKLGDTPARP